MIEEQFHLVPEEWRSRIRFKREENRARNRRLRKTHPSHRALLSGETLLYWNVLNRKQRFSNLYKFASYNHKTLHVHEYEDEELNDRGFKNMYLVWMD